MVPSLPATGSEERNSGASGKRRHSSASSLRRLPGAEAVGVVEARAVLHHVAAARQAERGQEPLHRGQPGGPAPGRAGRGGAERLEQLLGHEVVAALVEPADHVGERLRLGDVEELRPRRHGAEPHLPGHPDAAQLQQPPQRLAEVLRRVVDLAPGDGRAAAGAGVAPPPRSAAGRPAARLDETVSRRRARAARPCRSGCSARSRRSRAPARPARPRPAARPARRGPRRC